MIFSVRYGRYLRMMERRFSIGFAVIIALLWVSVSEAFDIQYPGEEGFFIKKPMIYMITADSSNPDNIGLEGIFTFGQSLITIDGKSYYDSVFESTYGQMHFYLGLDPAKDYMIEKGFKVGASELTLDPAVSGLRYPLSPGKSWSEKADLTAKNLEIPGLGQWPLPIQIKGVNITSRVSSDFVAVPVGNFNALLVETTFTGRFIGIPMTLVQRTWLNQDNVPVKRNFDFDGTLMYELALSGFRYVPWDLNRDGNVDVLDLVILAKNFGRAVDETVIPSPDVDGNGVVDISDLGVISFHFGEKYDPLTP
jgi:hypothetical protein